MDLDKMPHEILVVDDSGTDWAGNVILRHWGARVQLNWCLWRLPSTGRLHHLQRGRSSCFGVMTIS